MERLRTAVMLAGGAGLRLRPLTDDKPKVMIKILRKPILQWVIEWLRFNNISNLVIGVAYKKESIMKYFGNGEKFGVKIRYSVHSIEGETGEGFRLAISNYVDDKIFLAMNGDEIVNFRIEDMLHQYCQSNTLAMLAVTNPRSTFGVVRIDKDGLVCSFDEKPILPSLLVSVGVYIFNRDIAEYLPRKGPVEKTAFPLLSEKKLLSAHKIRGDWLTVNTMKDLEYVERTLKEKVEKETWLR